MKIWIIIIIILVLLIAAAVIRCLYELRTLAISRYEIRSDKISDSDSIKAVFISDLHGCEYGSENADLIELIEREGPDVILIGGDMLVGKKAEKDRAARNFLKKIAHLAPIYYAPGNHEKTLETLKMFRTRNRNYISFIKAEGIRYLKNESVDINEHVTVTGLDVDYEYYKKTHPEKMTSKAMTAYLGKPDKNRYNILLAHNPGFFDKYAENDIDLVLSGHYHGGSIRLPVIGGIISPQFRFFPNYSKGRFEKNGTTMIVTGGCGSHTVNLRLFNKPEIVVLSITGSGV